jgi:hypothetical protein
MTTTTKDLPSEADMAWALEQCGWNFRYGSSWPPAASEESAQGGHRLRGE